MPDIEYSIADSSSTNETLVASHDTHDLSLIVWMRERPKILFITASTSGALKLGGKSTIITPFILFFLIFFKQFNIFVTSRTLGGH